MDATRSTVSAATRAFRMRAMRHARFGAHTCQQICDTLSLTRPYSMARSRCPVRRGCSSRGIARAGQDAASRAFADASKPREAPGTRPPPLRADARSSQTVKPSCFVPRGTGRHKSRGGAPRGEHPRWDARRLASACGRTSLARRRVPLHPSACRRSAPSTFAGGTSKPRRTFCLASTIKLASPYARGMLAFGGDGACKSA